MTKPYAIPKALVWNAFQRVKANGGSAGVDQQSIAKFDGANLAVILPFAQVRRWATSDDVGIDETQSVGGGQFLRLLIEKDFECMHSRAEQDTDAFPNPRKIEC